MTRFLVYLYELHDLPAYDPFLCRSSFQSPLPDLIVF